MKIDDIREIIDLMATNGLCEFEMEENGARIAIKRAPAVRRFTPWRRPRPRLRPRLPRPRLHPRPRPSTTRG